MYRIVRLCVQATLVLCVSSTVSAAATFYVAPGGSDTSPGSLSAPLATPELALALAGAGDTVLLRGGTYSLSRSLQITQSGLTLAAYPGERARIVGGTSDLTNLTSVIIVYAGGVTLDGLELEGASYYGVKLDDAAGPRSGITLRRLYIHHTGRDGIKVQQADGLLIEDCEIAFTGVRDASNAEGIDIMASIGVTVRRNFIHDIATNGIFVKAATRQALIEANRVERTGYSGILLGSESAIEFMRDGAPQEAYDSIARNNLVVDAAYTGLGSIAGDNVRFENNTVIGAARIGQAVFRAAPNSYGVTTRGVVLQNNIFVLAAGSARPMVHLFDYSGALVSEANIWFSADGLYQFWRESSTAASSYWNGVSQWRSGMNVDWTSQAVDPQLDAAPYRPLAGSPAIDAGIAISGLAADYSGTPRPQGPAFDVGAHEYAVTTPPPPPPPDPDPDPVPAPVVAPLAPTNLSISQPSRSSVALTWVDQATNETGFRVERAVGSGGFAVIATVAADATSFRDQGLKRGKTYSYRVVAFNSAGSSVHSNTAVVTMRR